jgi:hypothetical protein
MAAAEEHTRWARETVRGVLEAADLDAAQIRSRAAQQSGDATRLTRLRVAAVLASSRSRLNERVELANRHAAEVTRKADETFEQSIHHADIVRERAAVDAARIVSEAEELAGEHTARAERRLTESESGARTIREQVALEVTRTQEELNELWRTAKAEQAAASAAARAEADEVRATARKLLADARAEVAILSQRRDAIAAELGSLSGVIEALAVAEAQPSNAAAPPPAAPVEPEPADEPEPAAEAEPAEPVAVQPVAVQPEPAEEAEPEPAPRPRLGKPMPAPWQNSDSAAYSQPMSLLEEMMRSE